MTAQNRALNTANRFDYVKERPTEMLVRQMRANRNAAKYRNPEKPWIRHHAHLDRFRPYFVGEMLAMRAELRKRARRIDVTLGMQRVYVKDVS